jgi:hypothetical protein
LSILFPVADKLIDSVDAELGSRTIEELEYRAALAVTLTEFFARNHPWPHACTPV